MMINKPLFPQACSLLLPCGLTSRLLSQPLTRPQWQKVEVQLKDLILADYGKRNNVNVRVLHMDGWIDDWRRGMD